MAAPMEVAVCADSTAQLWTCVVWELHSGANLLTYRGGQAGPRGLAVLNGEYLLAAQLGKNYISVWEMQRKVRRAGLGLRWESTECLGWVGDMLGSAPARVEPGWSAGVAVGVCACSGDGRFGAFCARVGLGAVSLR